MALFFIKRATELKKESLQIWFQKALKPRSLSILNEELVVKQHDKVLMHKAFYEMVSQLQVIKDKNNLQWNSLKILVNNRNKVSI